MRVISFFKKKEFNNYRLARRDYYVRNRPRTRLIFFILLTLMIIAGFVYFFVFSPVCKVKKIIILIDDYEILRYSPREIEDYVKSLLDEKYLFFVPADSLMLFPSDKIIERLKIDPRIETFSVEKKAPDALNIYLKVFKPEVALLTAEQNLYLLSEAGHRIQEIKENKGILPLIVDEIDSDKKIKLERIIQFIVDFNDNFNFKIDRVEIYQDKGVIATRAITSEKWQIYFDTDKDLDLQTSNLFLLLREKITDRLELSYIDLRFGQRIFYK